MKSSTLFIFGVTALLPHAIYAKEGVMANDGKTWTCPIKQEECQFLAVHPGYNKCENDKKICDIPGGEASYGPCGQDEQDPLDLYFCKAKLSVSGDEEYSLPWVQCSDECFDGGKFLPFFKRIQINF